jgi:hypothetical protein
VGERQPARAIFLAKRCLFGNDKDDRHKLDKSVPMANFGVSSYRTATIGGAPPAAPLGFCQLDALTCR